jgi:FMN phosphatase YigB (HAD superfamily)
MDLLSSLVFRLSSAHAMQIQAILFDLGDVIMQEKTEVKDRVRNTLSADLVSGMGEVIRVLKSRGYRLGLVADTRRKTAWNVLHQHGLYELFDALAISEEVGAEKPDPRIFRAALDRLGIPATQYGQVVMVGNNPMRDMRGANQMGLISVWFHWNDRYLLDSEPIDRPRFEVHDAHELVALIDQIEAERAA